MFSITVIYISPGICPFIFLRLHLWLYHLRDVSVMQDGKESNLFSFYFVREVSMSHTSLLFRSTLIMQEGSAPLSKFRIALFFTLIHHRWAQRCDSSSFVGFGLWRPQQRAQSSVAGVGFFCISAVEFVSEPAVTTWIFAFGTTDPEVTPAFISWCLLLIPVSVPLPRPQLARWITGHSIGVSGSGKKIYSDYWDGQSFLFFGDCESLSEPCNLYETQFFLGGL